jgi:hypothetical protein
MITGDDAEPSIWRAVFCCRSFVFYAVWAFITPVSLRCSQSIRGGATTTSVPKLQPSSLGAADSLVNPAPYLADEIARLRFDFAGDEINQCRRADMRRALLYIGLV